MGGRWISDPHIQVSSTLEYAKFTYHMNHRGKLLMNRDLFDTSFYDKLMSMAIDAYYPCLFSSRPQMPIHASMECFKALPSVFYRQLAFKG